MEYLIERGVEPFFAIKTMKADSKDMWYPRRKELEAAGSPEEEEQLFRQLVDRLYEHGKALSIATWFEIDDVIDPADTRRWLSTLLRSVPPQDHTSPTRPQVDTW